MTQEEKQVLFKDLCGRIPYHVRVKVWLEDGDTEEGPLDLQHNYGDVLLDAFYYNKITKIKPYLRPMSSMTEEEFEFLQEHLPYDFTRIYSGKFDLFNDIHLGNSVSIDDIAFLLDCLNRWCLDYRGLIPMGLALEAPKNMYND